MRRTSLLSVFPWLACAPLLAAPGVVRIELPPMGDGIHTVCLGGGCDFSEIQPALDAAAAGEEIRVSAEEYAEHLVIRRAVTLRGGWNEDFTAQTGQTTLDNPDAQDPIGHGRLVTATADSLDAVIAIDRFTFLNGNATKRPENAAIVDHVPPARAFRGAWLADEDLVAPEEEAAEDAKVARAATASPEADRLARLESLRPVRGPEDLRVAEALAGELPGPDYGGALFVTGASLRLTSSRFYFNVASDLGPGIGGAVAAQDVGRVEIRSCTFKWNTASSRYWGTGGAVSVAWTAADGLVFANNLVVSNQAGFASDPYKRDTVSIGGGLSAQAVPGARIQDNVFRGNLASYYGTTGAGGGLGLISARAGVVSGNLFEENTALARNRPEQTNDFGTGGGAEVNASRGVVVRDNTFTANIASLFLSGWGGGLSVNTSDDATISGNRFDENAAAFRMTEQLLAYRNAGGGGLYLSTALGVRVLRNAFTRNRAAWHQPEGTESGYVAHGGGLLAQQTVDDLVVSENVFRGNVATTEGRGWGGAFALLRQSTELATLEKNEFVGNVASVTGPGTGGAVFASSQRAVMRGNLLQGNVASESGTGVGGGAAFAATGSEPAPQQVDLDANRFLSNRAQGDGRGTGGGLSLAGSAGFTLVNNVFAGNAAAAGGGASAAGVAASTDGSRAVANNTFVGNHGDGLSLVDWPGSGVQVVNNILVGHALAVAVGQTGAGSSAAVSVDATLFHLNGRDVAGAAPVTLGRVVTGDPVFVAPDAWDFHIQKASPARDAGRPGPPAPDHDADGVLRPSGLNWDLGAFEWRVPGSRPTGLLVD